MTYGVGNPGPALGQAKKGGCVKYILITDDAWKVIRMICND
jgi:hypothetical protein